MTDDLEEVAEELGLDRARRHIFVCCEPQKAKCCDREEGEEAWKFLKKRIKELGLEDRGVLRTKADCLRVCTDGPIAVVWPDGIWYHHCTPERLERIVVEHLRDGHPVEEYAFARSKPEHHTDED